MPVIFPHWRQSWPATSNTKEDQRCACVQFLSTIHSNNKRPSLHNGWSVAGNLFHQPPRRHEKGFKMRTRIRPRPCVSPCSGQQRVRRIPPGHPWTPKCEELVPFVSLLEPVLEPGSGPRPPFDSNIVSILEDMLSNAIQLQKSFLQFKINESNADWKKFMMHEFA